MHSFISNYFLILFLLRTEAQDGCEVCVFMYICSYVCLILPMRLRFIYLGAYSSCQVSFFDKVLQDQAQYLTSCACPTVAGLPLRQGEPFGPAPRPPVPPAPRFRLLGELFPRSIPQGRRQRFGRCPRQWAGWRARWRPGWIGSGGRSGWRRAASHSPPQCDECVSHVSDASAFIAAIQLVSCTRRYEFVKGGSLVCKYALYA